MPAVPPSTMDTVAAATSLRSLPLRGWSGTSGAVSCLTRPVAASAISRSRRPAVKAGRGVGPASERARRPATSSSSRACSMPTPTSTGVPGAAELSTSAANSSARLRERKTGLIWGILGATSGLSGVSIDVTSDERSGLRGSSHTVRQELREVADSAQLELLDRACRAPEHLGRLRDRQALQEPHDEALLLLVRQLLEGRQQGVVGQGGEHDGVRALGPPVVQGHVLGGLLEAGPPRLEVVRGQVAGDRDQPGAEVLALPPEGPHAAQGPQERLRRQVLGQLHGSDSVVNI